MQREWCRGGRGKAGDICFKDSLQPYWRECTWLPLSNPCNQWLPGLSLLPADFMFYILAFHLHAALGKQNWGWVSKESETHTKRQWVFPAWRGCYKSAMQKQLKCQDLNSSPEPRPLHIWNKPKGEKLILRLDRWLQPADGWLVCSEWRSENVPVPKSWL